MRVIYLCSAWVLGIYLGFKFAPLPGSAFMALLPALALLLLSIKRRALLIWGLCLGALVAGMFRFEPADLGTLHYYNDGGTVVLRGVVDADPEAVDRAQRFRFSAREIDLDGEWRDVSGSALVYLPQFPSYSYGDVLELTGELKTPPRLGEFDYQEYLARQGIGSTMYYPQVELLERGRGFKPLEWIYSLRHGMAEALSGALPEPEASLAQSVFLGLRVNIPEHTYEAFSTTGTAHILAISGVHVGVVAGMLLSIGAWLFGKQRPTYILISIFVIWFYVILAGMQPSALRAAIMASLFLFASWIGRPRSAIIALAIAAAAMVGIRPQILWDVSFQLSFMAMAGLVFLAPLFQGWGRRVKLPGVAVDALAVALAAIIATLPLVAYYFGVVPLVGLPATLFALPALLGILVTSALVGFVGLFAPPLAWILGWLAFPFLWYMIKVVEIFAWLPFSHVEVPRFSGAMILIYYLLLAGLLWSGSIRRRLPTTISGLAAVLRSLRPSNIVSRARMLPTSWVILSLLIIAIVVWAFALTPPDDKLRVSFLDVGQGDAILIRTPSGQNILIDGGPDPQAICLQLGNELPFWEREIDLVILTHPHGDHLTGLVEVLSRYRVGQVLEPNLLGLEDFAGSPLYEEWQRLIEERGIEHTFAQAGQWIDLGDGIRLLVLHPQADLLTGTASDIDNNGIVLRLEYGDISFLLTADIQVEAEDYLFLHGVELGSTVLKVAHHGSATSTCPDFLAAANPGVAVISVGADNPWGHPSQDVVARLVHMVGEDMVYLTSESGTITFTTDGTHLWVKTSY